eukprot:Gregarina_sp_Poly_1__17@NODE_1003_length_5403_cov_517_252249_g371_i1_p6_GENE_NODE_1003_length_5403_cov_517_252249_g371_i1NODE_1003_length_5403_cov_517_252249_g371_i1_p6_ORF_typecomplete_len105_score5_68_NODE_1003_length_5403_cov_517_252249_g371_i13317
MVIFQIFGPAQFQVQRSMFNFTWHGGEHMTKVNGFKEDQQDLTAIDCKLYTKKMKRGWTRDNQKEYVSPSSNKGSQSRANTPTCFASSRCPRATTNKSTVVKSS